MDRMTEHESANPVCPICNSALQLTLEGPLPN